MFRSLRVRVDLSAASARVIERAALQPLPRGARIGTPAHSAVTQAFLGSVASDVLREVPCDVWVVPPRRGGVRSS